MPIKLHNSLSKRKELFAPLDANHLRMYVCGPTVYDRAHLGNARPVVVFDLLFRLLRHDYGADKVSYVRNFTDVDDKINARATELKCSIESLTNKTIGWFHDDMDALGALRPTHEPRATHYIKQMLAMIADLITRNHAYIAQNHVLFAVDSYADYGALSKRDLDDMIAGARVEIAPYKKNPLDFVLWKPSDKNTIGWKSPWGFGRPGWHIECSSMARDLLGDRFDIHGGGLDLQFPHHENEIAQSRACCGHDSFAQIWLHNEMLQVDGKKMSKSRGNFFTVRDVLNQGYAGEVIRMVMLSTHYRKPIDWTLKKADAAMVTLRKWRNLCRGVAPSTTVDAAVLDALRDDLNSAGAIALLHQIEQPALLKASAQMLGLLEDGLGGWDNFVADDDLRDLIQSVLAQRDAARASKDFSRSDQLRDGLVAAGVMIKDTPDGPQWMFAPDFDPKKLESLL